MYATNRAEIPPYQRLANKAMTHFAGKAGNGSPKPDGARKRAG
jgi:hypothetical protein